MSDEPVMGEGPGAGAELDPNVDATVVVRRDDDATIVSSAVADPDATIVVERGQSQAAPRSGVVDLADPDADDATVVVARPAADDDATRVVERGEQADRRFTHGGAVMNAPRRRDRRRPAPAPVSDEVLRTAEPAAGPGPLARYEVRELEASAPAAPPRFADGPAPTRASADALPSVARRSRRSAAASIAAFAAACVVAVAGLTAVAVVVLGELLG
ncbi:hypothetical protein MUN74_07980 [Agromyces endophyticus]|uniref:hypothetical protein n=1 Tax=Agromyces sp. H17E-10 TaxID=2932244 RepID=UPI001FD154F3|nr:hypothetical protein [Agromyces sp. H17E-10]UOQ90827.1 hypothetical protein MUN74_07980 [Agromyces sp. H17E-10]